MKKWLCAWLALLMVVCLTACGGGVGETESGATESPDLLDIARGARKIVPESGAAESTEDNGNSLSVEEIEEILADLEKAYADGGGYADTPADGGQYADIPAYEDTSGDASGETETPVRTPAAPAVSEDGSYTSKDDVALYLHLYQRLPGNFITKKQAQSLGWNGGSLEPYAPGKCIGGDYFGNYEGILPKGRSYRECDIDTLGAKSRGAKRIVYSDDGLIYYTGDHYNTFTLLYGEE